MLLGISDCLTGSEVRFDGGHKRSSLPHEALEGLFTWRTFCPEVAIGMGVPREPIRLVGIEGAPRAQGVKDASVDVTDALREHARAVVPTLTDIAGFVFMKNSPSCGLFRVKIYPGPDKAPTGTGRGIFAQEIVKAMPPLPVEDSGRMFDPVLLENFVTRTFAYAHWLRVRAAGLTPARLIAFHSAYKYLLMAHSITAYRAAGRLVSNLKGDVAAIGDDYLGVLMHGLSRPAKPGGHANVLQHLQGYVKKELDSATRQEFAALTDAYRRGEVPLLAPLTLLKHHLRRFPDRYALEQIYLNPHPPASGLRRAL
ncbi:MAG: DUF1722 domain-containing protein [Gammaproteobacteria bacterium]|nr:DUF1722 domain-containing protein [Gammaproteobacteria bacterium]